MFCRKCGTENPDDSVFCQQCGLKFTLIIHPDGEVEQAQSAPDDKEAPPSSYNEEELLRTHLADKFELINELGAGGMATVYLAREVALDRLIAIKMLPQTSLRDQELVARFVREAQITARMEHPNIVRIYTIHQDQDLVYFMMNYIPGGSLTDRIRSSGAQKLTDIIRWGLQICGGLDHAHRLEIVLRDLKPDNVLLDEQERAILTDFGIARELVGAQLTQAGTAIGTPHYMSPEQAQGKVLDSRSDLYSLGIMLYQMATGKLPFVGDEPASLIYMQVHEVPDPPDARSAAVPSWLSNIIMKCLEKDPAKRYDSAAQLEEALAAGAEDGATATKANKPLSQQATAAQHGSESSRTAVVKVASEDQAKSAAKTSSTDGEEKQRPQARARREPVKPAYRQQPSFVLVYLAVHLVAGALLAVLSDIVWPWSVRSVERLEGGDIWREWFSGAGGEVVGPIVLLGPLLGLLQWSVLRGYLKLDWRWVWATVLACASLAAAASVALEFEQIYPKLDWMPEMSQGVLLFGLVLMVLMPPTMQWLVLRRSAPVGWKWIVALVFGLVLAWGVGLGATAPLEASLGAQHGLFMARLVCWSLAGLAFGLPAALFLAYWPTMGRTVDEPVGLGLACLVALVLAWICLIGFLGLRSHASPVRALHFSQDGRYLLSVASQIKRWEVASGRRVTLYRDKEEGPYTAAAFSADAKYILVGFETGAAKLIQSIDGGELLVFSGQGSPITALAFSPDGKYLVSGAATGNLKLFKAADGLLVRVLALGQKPITALAFSPDSRHLLSADAGGTVRLWEMEKGREVASFVDSTGLNAVGFTPDSRQLLTIGGQLSFWPFTPKKAAETILEGNGFGTATYSPDGRYLLTGTLTGTWKLWDVDTLKQVLVFDAHRDRIEAVAFSGDSELFVSGGSDYQIKAWDVRSGRQVLAFRDTNQLYAAATALAAVLVVVVGLVIWRRGS